MSDLQLQAEERPGRKTGFAYPRPERFLEAPEIENVLMELHPSRVNFMGGEPTVSKDLQRILTFCKKK